MPSESRESRARFYISGCDVSRFKDLLFFLSDVHVMLCFGTVGGGISSTPVLLQKSIVEQMQQ